MSVSAFFVRRIGSGQFSPRASSSLSNVIVVSGNDGGVDYNDQLLGEGRLRRETVEGFPLFVGGEARAFRRAPPPATAALCAALRLACAAPSAGPRWRKSDRNRRRRFSTR